MKIDSFSGESMDQSPLKIPAPRIPVRLAVDFRKVYGRSRVAGFIRNISVTGAFLESQEEFCIGDRVTLEISVSGRKRSLQAQLIWKNGFGYGICFLPENLQDSQIVDDLVYFAHHHRKEIKGVLDEIFLKVS